VKDFKFYITLFFVFGMSFILIAQEEVNINILSPNQIKSFAKNANKKGDLYNASKYYEIYCNKVVNDYNAKFELAQIYRVSRDYLKALKLYAECYNYNSQKYCGALYYYALMLKVTGFNEEAKENFEKFIEIQSNKNFLNKAIIEIKGCITSDSLRYNPLEVNIEHLNNSINYPHIEFSPNFITDSSMVYGSYRIDSLDYFSNKNNSVRKLYLAERQIDEWIGKGEFGQKFNDDLYHNGNSCFSPDKTNLYFTKCKTNSNGEVICKIYVSTNFYGDWLEPIELPRIINDDNYTSTMPTIGINSETDDEILYFVSNRPGGFGGMDIWYSMYDSKNGMFSEPINAGDKINTTSDELSPYYDAEHYVLYYSSNGKPSMGGLDIFKVTGEKENWNIVENVGFPINSTYDDLYFALSPSKTTGMFASNRPGVIPLNNPTCCDDLYFFKFKNIQRIWVNGIVCKMDGIESIFDFNNKKNNLKNKSRIEHAKVKVSEFNVNTGQKYVVYKDSTDDFGNYSVNIDKNKNYIIEFSKDGYFSKKYILNNILTKEDTIITGIEPVNLTQIPRSSIIIKNIYYEFDQSELTQAAKNIIDTTLFPLLVQNPNLIIEISSHTDSKGSDDYNIKLSQRRAESVVRYLINKGISKQNLMAKGYGETVPLADNTNKDGSDNPEGRDKNRRTEFRVVGNMQNNQMIIYKK